jgi:uroporphyrin-III C-methyltransferase / precorrin-2 dehydrogenase / sirohydrochlorin ferrochelatase
MGRRYNETAYDPKQSVFPLHLEQLISSRPMQYFPLFANLRGRACLVVGGGEVALRKVRLLLAAGAAVTVNAPVLHASLDAWRREGRIRHLPGHFRPELLAGQLLAIAATGDPAVNRRVWAEGGRRGMLVNSVDDPAASSFIVPAIVDRSPLIVAVSSGGAAPVLARRLRQWLEAVLPRGLGGLARLAGELRPKVKRRLPFLARRGFWEAQFAGQFAGHALAGREREARRAFNLELEHIAAAGTPQGHISLVGAGPGDPALLTLKALKRLGEADVVLHDRLVSAEILELARRDAELVAVGKHAGGSSAQEEIHALMIRHARRGRRVVRLKGGDPFIFGRGGEELAAAREAGIPCEVVPGITAALGCAAATGLPLTLRHTATAVTFVTAQSAHDLDTLDWPGLGSARHTIAVYMGAAKAASIRDQLIRHGRPRHTPVAVIEKGTTGAQRLVKGVLCFLPELLLRHDIRAPVLIVIGETAALAEEDSGSAAVSHARNPGAEWPGIARAG